MSALDDAVEAQRLRRSAHWTHLDEWAEDHFGHIEPPNISLTVQWDPKQDRWRYWRNGMEVTEEHAPRQAE